MLSDVQIADRRVRRIMNLPPIYPITDVGLSKLSHAEQVRKFAAGGATFVQLRDKTNSPREFYEAAVLAVDAARELGVRILINDRVDIALACLADGVHLGQDDLSPMAARKLLGDKAIIGFSTHSVEQAQNAAKLPVDYIAIGPIFPTSTKQNADPAVGLDGLNAVRNAIDSIPLVAIGGITPENIADVLKHADSAALISSLYNDNTEITQTIRRFFDVCGNSN